MSRCAPLTCAGRAPEARLDRETIRAWHWLLATIARATGRKPVLPLFECRGLLDARNRYGWVLHASGDATKRACVYRFGSCASAYAMPEDVARLPTSRRNVVSVSAQQLETGGVEGVVAAMREAAGNGVSSQRVGALLLDVAPLVRDLPMEALVKRVVSDAGSPRSWRTEARTLMCDIEYSHPWFCG